MALALRLTRSRAVIYQDAVFQHNYLGNSLKRRYATSRDSSWEKPRITPTSTIPPNGTDIKSQLADTKQNPISSDYEKCSTSDTKDSTSKLNKMQILQEKKQEAVSKVKLSTQQVRKDVGGYVLTRYVDHVQNYDSILEKNFPSAVKVYRVFFDGVKEFLGDMKKYIKIYRLVLTPEKGITSLNRQELELYMQMPRDMLKVAPTFILSSLPVVGYAVFPLALMFPRSLLTSHFWTLQQKAEFKQFYFHQRLTYNRPVFRCLQSKLKLTTNHPKHEEFKNILGKLGSGTHPSAEEIINVKDLFAEPRFSLTSLHSKHIKHLNKLHGLTGGWFKRNGLDEHAYLLHYMDLAVGREGGVHNMPLESLRNACYIRGLNPVNLSTEDMVEWLRGWMKVSYAMKVEHITLFLHLPILLGYNHPNNWQLVYGKDKK